MREKKRGKPVSTKELLSKKQVRESEGRSGDGEGKKRKWEGEKERGMGKGACEDRPSSSRNKPPLTSREAVDQAGYAAWSMHPIQTRRTVPLTSVMFTLGGGMDTSIRVSAHVILCPPPHPLSGASTASHLILRAGGRELTPPYMTDNPQQKEGSGPGPRKSRSISSVKPLIPLPHGPTYRGPTKYPSFQSTPVIPSRSLKPRYHGLRTKYQ